MTVIILQTLRIWKGLNNMEMKYAVMAVKTKSDKKSIKSLAYQVSMITTKCVNPNIKILDCIVTFGGVKDILREVKRLKEYKDFQYLLIYSPKHIADNEEEYLLFVDKLKKVYDIEVITYK